MYFKWWKSDGRRWSCGSSAFGSASTLLAGDRPLLLGRAAQTIQTTASSLLAGDRPLLLGRAAQTIQTTASSSCVTHSTTKMK